MRAILLVAALVVGVIGLAVIDRESGVPKWLALRGDLAAARARIERLSREAADLERQIQALEGGGFPLEQAIREDLGLAKPGEVVVHFGSQPAIGRGPGGSSQPEPWPSGRGD